MMRSKCVLKLGITKNVFLRPKNPIKVHVWAGISLIGPTKICIFEGTMDAELYEEILRSSLFLKNYLKATILR